MNQKQPKYFDMFEILRKDIENGIYPAGSFLPTENDLVRMYQVSKTTIRHAVKLLRENRLVDVRQGSGTRILAPAEKEVPDPKYHTAHGHIVTVSARYSGSKSSKVKNTLSVTDQVPASAACAEALGIPEGSSVWRLQRLQRVGDHIFGYMVNYLPADRFPDLPQHGEITIDLYGHLKKHYGSAAAAAASDEKITPVIAGFMEAQYLDVPAGTPLLLLARRVTDQDEAPLEYCETLVRPDRFSVMIHTEYDCAKREAPERG
ncbi:MAG: GntR family transcriptional regulator [Stomatobaculum sp.]|nr:GntR family transcriptional regulator [Stomatobaculum sp.]